MWSIKPAMRIKYGLREIVIPKKKVPTRRPKNESEAAKARRLMQLESAPEEKENGDKPKWKVGNLNIIFDYFLTIFMNSASPARAVLSALLGVRAYRMLIGARDPMVCSIHVFR